VLACNCARRLLGQSASPSKPVTGRARGAASCPANLATIAQESTHQFCGLGHCNGIFRRGLPGDGIQHGTEVSFEQEQVLVQTSRAIQSRDCIFGDLRKSHAIIKLATRRSALRGSKNNFLLNTRHMLHKDAPLPKAKRMDQYVATTI
jgi:hypothetical protein